MRVLIAAAGTGGHINPGIAIANKIKEEEPDSKILFIGTERGLEKDLVPRSGYELKTINAYGIRRSFTLENIKRFFKTMHSVKEVEVTNIEQDEYKGDKLKDDKSYIVDLKITYDEDLDYPDEVKLVLAHVNEKLEIVKID